MPKELDGQYSTLFARSGSIPPELAEIATDNGDESISFVVTQRSTARTWCTSSASWHTYNMCQCSCRRRSPSCTVAEEPMQNQVVVSRVIFDLLHHGFYDEERLLEVVAALVGNSRTMSRRSASSRDLRTVPEQGNRDVR
jgi:hypothetical protein